MYSALVEYQFFLCRFHSIKERGGSKNKNVKEELQARKLNF